MKTFEEKYTAWIDGKLSGEELAEFEKELGAEAQSDKVEAQKLTGLLRSYSGAPELRNAEFFNHQLLQQITPAEAPQKAVRRSWWSLPRMAFAGACSLAAAFAVYQMVVPHTPKAPPGEAEYLAKVLETRAGDPSITATAFHNEENNVTVIWLEGLQSIPKETGL